MFRDAYLIARQFTSPVVLSRLTNSGQCSSSIGAYVVINSDGWIVTAYHIIEQLQRLLKEEQESNNHADQFKVITTEAGLAPKERSKRLAKLGKLSPHHTSRCSVWWARNAQLVDIEAIPAADLAVGRLEPFNAASVTTYPVFKDPTKDFEPGVSLCKLGFPFHSITPTWEPASQTFKLPVNALPMPLFPLDGTFTRVCQFIDPSNQGHPPILFVETSTPGLKGQSGGPTFDNKGTIWAIQSKTYHLPLGFDPPVPNGKHGEKEHQFLNVGLGVHPTTMFELFNRRGINFQVSAY